MTKAMVLAVVAALLGACSAIRSPIDDPYAAAPITCAGIDRERADLRERIATVETLRGVENAVSAAGVAAAAAAGSPAAGVAAYYARELATADLVDIEPERERDRFLGLMKGVRAELQRSELRLAGAMRLELAPGDCL